MLGMPINKGKLLVASRGRLTVYSKMILPGEIKKSYKRAKTLTGEVFQ